ncbi:MAG: hypothetical protein RLZZ546_591, partial [Bacteroidota bacterium]
MRYLFQILLSFFGRKSTPILMANNPFLNTTAAYAMAAFPLVTTVPIQDVQLFDYAVAHKSVTSTELSVKNASYGLTANTDDTYIIGTWAERSRSQDPYTSDQQRSRDQYEINETDWNEVTFEQIDGTSKCKLALNNDWIKQNKYSVDATVNMNLPEQGISGPFKITSIKHIIPQKKPVDEDEADDYEYKPVTGLFVHESNDVWKIKFDDGTELGVTNNHPIYSVSKGDWQHAGHLEIGEEVLAKVGNTKVISKERDLTVQPVYNLEIKDLHNFLVGEDGVVVHNTCFNIVKKRLEDLKVGNLHLLRIAPDNKMKITGPNSDKVKEKFPNARRNGSDLEVCYDDLGFPDFSDFIPNHNGNPLSFDINMTGDGSDMTEARQKLNALLGSNFTSNGQITIPGYEGVSWTFHH